MITGCYHYEIGGLWVASELDLPGMRGRLRLAGEPDVRILLADPIVSLNAFSFGHIEDGFQVSVPHVGKYVVHAGCEIRISRVAGANEDDELRTWLLGSAMGALLHQRGVFPLHASSINIDGGCVAFAGPCGAGKSTLCAFFSRQGYPVVSDDVLAIEGNASGMLWAAGTSSSLRLMGDSVRALKMSESTVPGCKWEGKHLLHPTARSTAPTFLRGIYALEDQPSGESMLSRIPTAGALKVLLDNIYRTQFAHALGIFEHTFALATVIANNVPVFRLVRPRTFHSTTDVVELLKAHWRSSNPPMTM